MTSETKVQNEHAFQPDDEVLANAERTRRLMEEPKGLDMNAIVTRSVAAYWAAADERAGSERALLPDLRSALVPDLRSALHWRAVRQLSTWGDFWADWGAVTVMVAVVGIGAVGRYGVSTTASALKLFAASESFVPAAGAVVGTSVLCAWLYRNGNARNFVGAAAGAVLLAVVAGGFAHSISSIDAMTDLAKTQLEQAALNLMITHESTGKFDRLSVTGASFALSTSEASEESAVYFATAKGVPGKIVADVGPVSGTVTWSDSKATYVVKLFKGTVENASPDALVIQDASGQTLRVKRGAAVFPMLKMGNSVLGAYDTKTGEASVVMVRPTPQTASP